MICRWATKTSTIALEQQRQWGVGERMSPCSFVSFLQAGLARPLLTVRCLRQCRPYIVNAAAANVALGPILAIAVQGNTLETMKVSKHWPSLTSRQLSEVLALSQSAARLRRPRQVVATGQSQPTSFASDGIRQCGRVAAICVKGSRTQRRPLSALCHIWSWFQPRSVRTHLMGRLGRCCPQGKRRADWRLGVESTKSSNKSDVT